MTPVIRIDDEVMSELKKRATDLDLVFEPPNATLRIVLGLDSLPSRQTQAAGSPTRGEKTMTKAPTLVIHAPYSKGKPGAPYSWEEYFQTGVGKGYAISQEEVSALTSGSKVVVLRNDRNKKRVEGTLVELVRTNEKTSQGIQRYDVLFKDQVEVEYSYKKPEEKLTRRGVKVIDC
jgi:hypothetical protein